MRLSKRLSLVWTEKEVRHGGVIKDKAGEVTERPKVQHWKCCVGETPPWVRIPSSPLKKINVS